MARPAARRRSPTCASCGEGEQWRVSDDTGSLPLADGSPVWTLLAVSGGEPVDVFGEVESGAFRPLSVWLDDRVMGL